MVSWTPGSGILHYNASADAFNIHHKQSCFTNGTSCNISFLHCGESYKVSVSGQGQNCPSPAQDWHRINTGNDTDTRVDQIWMKSWESFFPDALLTHPSPNPSSSPLPPHPAAGRLVL